MARPHKTLGPAQTRSGRLAGTKGPISSSQRRAGARGLEAAGPGKVDGRLIRARSAGGRPASLCDGDYAALKELLDRTVQGDAVARRIMARKL